MSIPRNQLKRKIIDALIKGVQRNGERAFALSQQTELCYVPVDTGTLKKSGYFFHLENGIELGYSVSYSARVHFGGPAIPFKGTQIVHTKSYTRAGYVKKNGVFVQPVIVKEHDKKYVDKRLIGFRPKITKFERGDLIFRVLKEEPARIGTLFLQRAIEKSLKDYLISDIEFYLRPMELEKIRRR